MSRSLDRVRARGGLLARLPLRHRRLCGEAQVVSTSHISQVMGAIEAIEPQVMGADQAPNLWPNSSKTLHHTS